MIRQKAEVLKRIRRRAVQGQRRRRDARDLSGLARADRSARSRPRQTRGPRPPDALHSRRLMRANRLRRAPAEWLKGTALSFFLRPVNFSETLVASSVLGGATFALQVFGICFRSSRMPLVLHSLIANSEYFLKEERSRFALSNALFSAIRGQQIAVSEYLLSIGAWHWRALLLADGLSHARDERRSSSG